MENLVGGLEGLLKSAGVTVWPGRAELLPEKRIRATLPGGEKRTAEFDKLIIATGSSEVVPPVPGVDLPGVIFSKEALALLNCRPAWRVGGGVIALEALYCRFRRRRNYCQRSVLAP